MKNYDGRHPITVQQYLATPALLDQETPTYWFFKQDDELGLDPWRVIDGFDPHVDGSKVDVWLANGRCLTVENPEIQTVWLSEKHYYEYVFKPRITPTTERVEVHNGGINFNYFRRYEEYRNPNFNNQRWHADQVKFFRVGFSWPLFDHVDFTYDGNTLKSITILGLEFSLGDFTGCEALEPEPKGK